MLRKVMAAVLAGLAGAVVAGVVLGAVSRALMATIAVAAGEAVHFSWAGSAGILLIYVLAVLPGALVAAASRRWWRWLLPIAGALFLCLPAVGVAGEEIGGTGHFTALQWVLVGAASFGVFATIAALPVLTVRIVDLTVGRRTHHRPLASEITARPI